VIGYVVDIVDLLTRLRAKWSWFDSEHVTVIIIIIIILLLL